LGLGRRLWGAGIEDGEEEREGGGRGVLYMTSTHTHTHTGLKLGSSGNVWRQRTPRTCSHECKAAQGGGPGARERQRERERERREKQGGES